MAFVVYMESYGLGKTLQCENSLKITPKAGEYVGCYINGHIH